MGGLIFDTEALYQKALLGLADERKLPSITQAMVDQTVGLSWSSTRTLLALAPPGHVDVDELIAAWTDRYEALAQHELTLKPGVRELLAVLDSCGIARAVATGSYRDVALRHLSEFDLFGRFHSIVTKEDYVHGKPAPEPFLTSAERLQVDPSRCWALEDSRNGIRSAHDAGMVAIMIPDLIMPDAETLALCCHIGTSLNDVVRLIEDRR